MDTIKVIDLSSSYSSNTKKLSKKQIYKEILSSSDRVKDIISRRKKTKRFDYLNTIPLKQNVSTQPIPSHQQFTPIKQPIPSHQQFTPIKQPIHTTESKKNIVFGQPVKVQENKTRRKRSMDKKRSYTKIKSNDRKISDFFEETKRPPNNISKIPKKKHHKQERSIPKSLNQTQIIEIIKIIYKLNDLEEFTKLHKVIRRLNKLQTNQILFALRLIKNKSNAPVALLKNTLLNFVTGNVKVYRA